MLNAEDIKAGRQYQALKRLQCEIGRAEKAHRCLLNSHHAESVERGIILEEIQYADLASDMTRAKQLRAELERNFQIICDLNQEVRKEWDRKVTAEQRWTQALNAMQGVDLG